MSSRMLRDKPARGDPDRDRSTELAVGSQEELGRLLIKVLREEGDSDGQDPKYADGDFYEYVSPTGLWPVIDDVELHRIIGSFDGSKYQTPGKKHQDVLRLSQPFAKGAIERATYRVAAPDFFADARRVLAFTSGVVRITKDGEIKELPHAPENRARVGYNFAFDRNAKCPRFMRMMREHFEGDEDAQQKIWCEQEFFGNCLFGEAPEKQKCLALPSDGGSGRSTLLQVVEQAFPSGTVSHIDAKELRSAERRTRLVGKLMNFSDEVPTNAFLESEDFKRVVTGNFVSAEGKYRASFEYRPIAGHVFPVQIHGAAELSDAFFRRFTIIRYNHNFENSPKRDYDLAAKIIKTELPGIVAWMIEGAARLRRNGHYTIPASHAAEEAKWKLTADTVRAFLDTTYTSATFKEPRKEGYDLSGKPNGLPIRNHDWTAASDLYAGYREWCDANGHRKPVANPEFKRRIEKIGYLPVHTHKGNFYGVRELERAQRKENERAKETGTPPETLEGALQGVLQGGQSELH